MSNLPSHTYDVLCIYGFGSGGADAESDLFWRIDNGEIRFLADCSDVFAWATADCEQIEPEDIPLLRSCLEDLKEFGEQYLISELFAARKRKMRPMRLWLGTHPSQLAGTYNGWCPKWKSLQLFLDCGPERDPKSEG